MLPYLQSLIIDWWDLILSCLTLDNLKWLFGVVFGGSFALFFATRGNASGRRRALLPVPYFRVRRAYARAFLVRYSRHVLPVSAELTLRLGSRPGANDSERLTVDKLIAVLLERPRADNKILLIGAMGAGKSVLLRQLAQRIASQAATARRADAPIPVLLSMQDYDGKPIRELLQISISGSCGESVATRIIRSLDRLIEKGRLVVLIDALEEAPQQQLSALTRHLTRFQAETPVPMVLAVRQESALVTALDGLQPAWLEELDDCAVAALVRAETKDTQDAESVLADLQQSGFLAAGGHARNPFWLCKMLEAKEYSSRRAKVIGTAVENVLRKELHRSYLSVEPVEPDTQKKIRLLMVFLELVSARMVSDGASSLQRHVLPDLLVLSAEETGARGASPDLIETATRALVLRWSSLESEIRFSHQSFKHFFAARWFLRHSAVEQLIDSLRVEHLTEIEYWEIVAFVLELEARLERPALAVTVLTRDDTPSRALVLAIAIAAWPRDRSGEWRTRAKSIMRDWLSQPAPLATTGVLDLVNARSNDVLIDLLDEVAKESPDTVGRQAVEVISHISSPRAARKLCRFLTNDNLCNTAADQLVRLGDVALPALREARALEALRVNANQVLIRIGAPAIALFLESLRLSDGPRGSDAAECLVQIGRDSTAALLDELRAATGLIRERVVHALARIADPRSLTQLIAIAHDDSVMPMDLARLDAISGLGRFEDKRAVSVLLDIAEQSVGKRRVTALEAIGNQGDPSVIEALLALHDRLLKAGTDFTPDAVAEEIDTILSALKNIGVHFADRVTRAVLQALRENPSFSSVLRQIRPLNLGSLLAATISESTVEDVLSELTDLRTDQPVRTWLTNAIAQSNRVGLHQRVEQLLENMIPAAASRGEMRAEKDLVILLTQVIPRGHLPKLLHHLKERHAEARVALVGELDQPWFYCMPVANALVPMLAGTPEDYAAAHAWFLHARLTDSVALLKNYAIENEGHNATKRATQIAALAETIGDQLPPPHGLDPEVLVRMEVCKSTRGLGKILNW